MNSKLSDFISRFKSLTINSLAKNNTPFSSYAPFVKYENKYYVYLSDMAKHAHNLRENPKCSIFFIEDEKDCKNIFARKRVVFQCYVNTIEKNSEYESQVLNKFEEYVDKSMIQNLRKMSDFNLFEFTPFYGEAVFGFGKAYNIAGENFDELLQRETSGKGHGINKK